MDIHLTERLDGEVLSDIALGIETYENAMNAIDAWKERNKNDYKVDPYNRIIFCAAKLLVDFGDYHKFMMIDNMSPAQWEDINFHFSRG